MSVTKGQIKALTPEHRIVWHQPPGQPVEMGLYVGEYGHLCTDTGHIARYGNGSVPTFVRSRIVRIIPPAFTPRRGMVIGRPGLGLRRLIHTGDRTDTPWLGYAPELKGQHWFTTEDARYLIETVCWEVVGDLTTEEASDD